MSQNDLQKAFLDLDDETVAGWLTESEQHIRQLMECVRQGDSVRVEFLITEGGQRAPKGEPPLDELRHTKNLVIILIHLLKNAAVEGGVNPVLASKLEELMIQRTERGATREDVQELADEAKREFCRRVQKQSALPAADGRIQKAIRYIRIHCTRKLTLEEVAAQTGLTREYFSTLFHAQMGMTVSACIRWEKVQLAKQMLADTDVRLAEISSLLAFSSQSHFQRVFRQVEGCTPMEYRRRPVSRW